MQISEINIYPIKSLRGISVESAAVEERGLRLDRRWMLVDERRQFLTQREYPSMALIKIAIGENHLTATSDGKSISVPFEPNGDDTATVKIWSSSVRANVYGREINAWFSAVIGETCRLVLMPESTRRKVNPFYAVRKFKDEVSFADGYPFLLIGQSSLDDLNSRLDQPLPMNRFRPNFVVSGADAFEEDTWKRIRIGETEFHVVKPCARCVITTVDQTNGQISGKEPLKTLAAYRNVGGNVMFGQNLIAETSGSRINLGDPVTVIRSTA